MGDIITKREGKCSICKKLISVKGTWFNQSFIYQLFNLKCWWHGKTKHKVNVYNHWWMLLFDVLSLLFLFVLACILLIIRIILYPFFTCTHGCSCKERRKIL